jgi:osmotically-inducible protein OsmY
MKYITFVRLFSGTLALALAAGCASSHHYSEYDSRAANAALETSVRTEVNRYGDLAATTPDVRIQARNGVVTLTGTVPGERERQMLDDVVRNTSGVVAVHDQLQIVYPPRVYSGSAAPVVITPTPVPAVVVPRTPSPVLVVHANTDKERRIADNIVDQLHHDEVASTSLQDMSITVDGGDVYLRGYVPDSVVRQAALNSVRHSSGVRTVFDELQVR